MDSNIFNNPLSCNGFAGLFVLIYYFSALIYESVYYTTVIFDLNILKG